MILGPTVAQTISIIVAPKPHEYVCAPVIPLAHHDSVFPYNHHFSFILLANCPVASLNRGEEFMTIQSGRFKVVNVNLLFFPQGFWNSTCMTHIADEKQSQTASHPHLRCDSRCLTGWQSTSQYLKTFHKLFALQKTEKRIQKKKNADIPKPSNLSQDTIARLAFATTSGHRCHGSGHGSKSWNPISFEKVS